MSPSSLSSLKQSVTALDKSWFVQNSNETDMRKKVDSMQWPESSAMKKLTAASCDKKKEVSTQAAVPLATRNQIGRFTMDSFQKQTNPIATFRPNKTMQ